jgi:hypothetical protein
MLMCNQCNSHRWSQPNSSRSIQIPVPIVITLQVPQHNDLYIPAHTNLYPLRPASSTTCTYLTYPFASHRSITHQSTMRLTLGTSILALVALTTSIAPIIPHAGSGPLASQSQSQSQSQSEIVTSGLLIAGLAIYFLFFAPPLCVSTMPACPGPHVHPSWPWYMVSWIFFLYLYLFWCWFGLRVLRGGTG